MFGGAQGVRRRIRSLALARFFLITFKHRWDFTARLELEELFGFLLTFLGIFDAFIREQFI